MVIISMSWEPSRSNSSVRHSLSAVPGVYWPTEECDTDISDCLRVRMWRRAEIELHYSREARLGAERGRETWIKREKWMTYMTLKIAAVRPNHI